MPARCTLDGFVITPIEPQGSRYAGTDHGGSLSMRPGRA
jgi:hypothetical protein